MSKVVFVGSETHNNQSAVTASLSAVHASGAITTVTTVGHTLADSYANAWAVTNGIPFISLGRTLENNGYDQYQGTLFAMQQVNPTHVVLAGTSLRTTNASAEAGTRGHTVIKV